MFVVFGYERSGTHLLASLLDSHPSLMCYDHLCLKNKRGPYLPSKNINETKHLKDNEGFILIYWQLLKYENAIYNHIKNAKILHIMRRNLRAHACSYILLTRKNKKKGGLSGIDAHSSQLVDPNAVLNTIKDQSIVVGEDEISITMNKILSVRKQVFKKFNFPNRLDIYLEDLTLGKDIQCLDKNKSKDILRFLDVDIRMLHTKLHKTWFDVISA